MDKFDHHNSMQHENLRIQNEGFRCDPKHSVRGNLFLVYSCDGMWQSVFKVLKLTLIIEFTEGNLVISKSILQNYRLC